MKTTLRKLIEDEFTYTKESFDDIQYHTYKNEDLDIEIISKEEEIQKIDEKISQLEEKIEKLKKQKEKILER